MTAILFIAGYLLIGMTVAVCGCCEVPKFDRDDATLIVLFWPLLLCLIPIVASLLIVAAVLWLARKAREALTICIGGTVLRIARLFKAKGDEAK